MDLHSYTGNADITGIEALYEQYSKDPLSVDAQWRQFFEGFDFARASYPKKSVGGQQFSNEVKVLKLHNA